MHPCVNVSQFKKHTFIYNTFMQTALVSLTTAGCPVLSSIPFGSVSQTGREIGDTATYTCNTGYELVGPPTRTCTQINPATADFVPSEPSCRRKFEITSDKDTPTLPSVYVQLSVKIYQTQLTGE